MNNKTHAKDYLYEYINNNNKIQQWLILLINTVINKNGKISDDEKKEIYNNLLTENDLNNYKKNVNIKNETNIDSTKNLTNKQNLILKEITHIKGVNALIPNQSIPLSETCNIIYGLNGTGKSGYFRIMHNIAEKAINKKILNNIYNTSKSENAIEANIKFSLNKEENTFNYKGDKKNNLFNQIKFFDTEYLPIYLKENQNDIDIEPLGLNFFRVIIKFIEEFKTKLETEQSSYKENNFNLNLEKLIKEIKSEDLKQLLIKLQKNKLNIDEKKSLENNTIFTDQDNKNLNTYKKEKSTLENNNTEDTKTILIQEKREIDNLNKDLLNNKSQLEEITKNTSSLIENYLKKNKTKNEREEEFKIIKNIPSQNTNEWKQFIESAKEYGEIINKTTNFNKNNCIYCHQPLNDDAIKLTQAYLSYLNDKSIQEFKDADTKINNLKQHIESFNTDSLNKNDNISDWKTKIDISENLNKVIHNI